MNDREKERLLLNLRSTPRELDDLIRDLDAGALRWRPIPTRWSINEIVCHLRDVELLAFRNRYVTMLSENQPYLARVDQDQLAAEGNYIDQDGAAAFAEFDRVRQETVTILRSAEAERWLRIGSHWNGGQITVHDLAVRQCEHDMNHLAQVKDIVRLRMPW